MRPIGNNYDATNSIRLTNEATAKPKQFVVTEKNIENLAAEIDKKREQEDRLRGEAPPTLLERIISKILGVKYRKDTGIDPDVIDSKIEAEKMLNIRAANYNSLAEAGKLKEGTVGKEFDTKA